MLIVVKESNTVKAQDLRRGSCEDIVSSVLTGSSHEVHRRGAMKIKPLGDRIVVERSASQEKTAGGILLPDSAKNKPQKGKVLAVGPGKMLKDGNRRSLQVKEGDTVLFTSWAGDEFRDKTKSTILLMREEDVLAVVDE
jgi:chaperonin GroES